MIRLLDQQCALYERLLPPVALEKARAAHPTFKPRKQPGKTARPPAKSD
jgi:hypothetical protein